LGSVPMSTVNVFIVVHALPEGAEKCKKTGDLRTQGGPVVHPSESEDCFTCFRGLRRSCPSLHSIQKPISGCLNHLSDSLASLGSIAYNSLPNRAALNEMIDTITAQIVLQTALTIGLHLLGL